MDKTIFMAEMLMQQTRVIHYQSRIQSGVYKTRVVTRGYAYEKLTEQELLEDEMETLETHVNNMQKLLDYYKSHHTD